MALERELPHSADAERALQGLIILDNSLITQVSDSLQAGDFYLPSSRLIYPVMKSLSDRGFEINPILISNELTKDGTLERAGGREYINSLLHGLPHTTNLAPYIKLVKETSRLRTLYRTAMGIAGDCLEQKDEADVIVNQAQQAIFELGSVSTERRVMSMKQVAAKAREHLDSLNSDNDATIGTPWPEINRVCRGGLNPSELWGLIAVQKHGKSAFAKQLAAYAAKHGHRVLIFSREMSELKIFYRLLAPLTDVPVGQIRNGLDENRVNRSKKATYALEDLGIFFDTMTADIDEARTRTREMVRLEGVDLVIGDYTNQFSAKVRKSANRAEEVAAIWRGFKNIAQDFQIAALALGHPTSESFEKPNVRKGSSDRQAPYFHQSAESREAAKAVDLGAVLWTELNNGEPGARPATFYVDYQRDEDAGTEVNLTFDGRIMEFRSASQPVIDFND